LETGVPGENHRPATSHLQTLSLNVVSSTPAGFSYNVGGAGLCFCNFGIWKKSNKELYLSIAAKI
jgi:hypothetical protein